MVSAPPPPAHLHCWFILLHAKLPAILLQHCCTLRSEVLYLCSVREGREGEGRGGEGWGGKGEGREGGGGEGRGKGRGGEGRGGEGRVTNA